MQEILDNMMERPAMSGGPGPLRARLFHYTSPAGAIGIIKSKSLWATRMQYLNDAEELRHGANMAKLKLIEASEKETNTDFKKVLVGLSELTERMHGVNIHVSSFTANGDLLSQWRAYAQSGLSLGFDYDDLLEIMQRQDIRLVKCVYSHERKTQVLQAVINECRAVWDKHPSTYTDASNVAQKFMELFFLVVPAFKHSGFAEEEEWRAITAPLDYRDARLEVRATNNLIIPYILVDLDIRKKLDDKGNSDISLNSAVIGPSPHRELLGSSFMNATMINKIAYGGGLYSQTPYRTF